MIFTPFVLLLFLVAAAQALTYSTSWSHPRTGPSSLALKIPAAWASSAFSQYFATCRPRLVTTFLSSSSPDKFDALEKEIGALKHLLKGGNSTTASEDIRESILIYEGGDKDWLRGILKDLQREKSALQEKETALIISQAAVGSKGPAPPRVELTLPSDVLPGRRDEYRSFLPMVDAQLTTLLKGLACSTVDDLEGGVRAIRIGNNEKFILNKLAGDTIYERRFYPQLISAIRCADLRVLLLSNPGTGKSVFQFYLLARYLNPSLFTDAPLSGEIKFGSEVAPKVVIRHLPKVGIQVWFLTQQVVHSISTLRVSFDVLRCFDPATTLYFFEPGKTKNIEPYADENLLSMSTLATVSPDRSRYNEFVKVAKKVYMPVFTEEELVAIGRDMKTRPDFNSALENLYSDKEIRGRFEIFNGIIRHVLPQSQDELQQVLQERAVALEGIDAVKFLYGDIESQIISHYAAVYDVAADENGAYDYFKMGLSIVNQEIKKKLQDRLEKLSLNERPAN